MTATIETPPATDTPIPYREMAEQLQAAYIADNPGMVGWEKRDGGRAAIYGPKDFDGDAGARAITLAATGGQDDKDKYKEIERYINDRMRKRYPNRSPSAMPKHSHWDIRADAIHLATNGMVKVYEWAQGTEWRKGRRGQPTITEALDEWGSGIAPISRTRYRLLGAAYIDERTRTAYDIYDPRLYIYPVQGGYADNPPAGETADGTELFHPGDYCAYEAHAKFYYAYPQR